MTGIEFESSPEISEIIALRQLAREAISDSLDFRLVDLHRRLEAGVPGQAPEQFLRRFMLQDRQHILAEFEVDSALRDFLLEENEDGDLIVSVNPATHFMMHVLNGRNSNLVVVGSQFRPYVMAIPNSQKDIPSQIQLHARTYTKMLGEEKNLTEDYAAAKKIIGAVEQIAILNGKMI